MVRINLTADTPGKRRPPLALIRVLYVPDANENILSRSQLDSEGISTVIEDRKVILLDRQEMRSKIGSASRRKSDDLLVLNFIFVKHRSSSVRLSTVEVNEINMGVNLWHHLCGIFGKDRVKTLAGGIAEGMEITKKVHKMSCNLCLLSKKRNLLPVGALIRDMSTISFNPM